MSMSQAAIEDTDASGVHRKIEMANACGMHSLLEDDSQEAICYHVLLLRAFYTNEAPRS